MDTACPPVQLDSSTFSVSELLTLKQCRSSTLQVSKQLVSLLPSRYGITRLLQHEHMACGLTTIGKDGKDQPFANRGVRTSVMPKENAVSSAGFTS
eukprot:2417546-Amphidinium_carterae.1